MATLYSSNFDTSNTYIKYRIELTINSQDVTNNTSNVTVKVKFWRTNTGYETYGSGTMYCKINGTTYSASVTSSQKITNSGIYLFTKTLNISHNADGTKSLPIYAWIDHSRFNSSSSNGATFTLTTIPRATTPKISGTKQLGGTITISTAGRASSAFTHSIYYSWGSQVTDQLIASGVATSKSFTIPKTLAESIMSATSGTMTIKCVTYSGSTAIGTKTVSFSVSVPNTAEFQPIINSVAVEAEESVAVDAYVTNKTRLRVTVTATGAYVSGSSNRNSFPVKGTVTVDGKTYTVAMTQNSSYIWYITTDTLKNAGSGLQISVTVTDSRGRSVTNNSATYTAYDYFVPIISAFTVERCTAAGVVDNAGEYLKCSIDATVAPVNNLNAKNYKIVYESGGSEVTLKSGTLASYDGVQTYFSADDGKTFSNSSAWVVRLYVLDSFNAATPATISVLVPTEETFMDWRHDGRGIAFGKVSERDGFECAWPMWDTNGYRMEIESMEIGEGYGHILYANGMLRQWGTVSITPTAVNAVTSLTVNFPLPYALRPHITGTLQSNVPQVIDWGMGGGTTSAAALTGLVIYLVRTNLAATTFRWEAFGMRGG